MLQNCARRLRAAQGGRWAHTQLSKSTPSDAVGVPQAVSEDVDWHNNASQATDRDAQVDAPKASSPKLKTAKRYDALLWPEVNSADLPLDLTKTYVQRYAGKHFDTVIDPKFPAQTGLPMTVYISQKQDNRPASIEVSQFYGNHHNLQDIFTVTVPRTTDDTPRIIGDTGAIKLQDLAKACRFIELNQNLLLEVWDNGEDESNDLAFNYYEYIVRIV